MSLCEVCSLHTSKYKCPSCKLQYCSLSCCKVHKETHTEGLNSPPQPESPTRTDIPLPDKGAIPQADNCPSNGTPQAATGQFDGILSSIELNTLFQKYPSLRSQLYQIFTAIVEPLPLSTDAPSLDQKRFGRGGPHGRGRGRGGGPSWTLERGIRDGLSRLKRAKELGGIEGEGMREFMHLVLKSTKGVGGYLRGESSTGNEGVRAFAALVEKKPHLLNPNETIPDERYDVANAASA